MWNSDLESPAASPFSQAKSAPTATTHSSSVGQQHTPPPDASPGGTGTGGGAIEETISVMSHWADAHEAPRGQSVLTGLGGPEESGSSIEPENGEHRHDPPGAAGHEDEQTAGRHHTGTVALDGIDAHIDGHAAPRLAAQSGQVQQHQNHLEHQVDTAGEEAAQGAAEPVQSDVHAPQKQGWGLGDLWNKAKATALGATNTVKQGAAWVGDQAEKGASWVGDKLSKGDAWVDDKVGKGTAWAGDKAQRGVAWVGDKLSKGDAWVDDKVNRGVAWAGDKLKKGASWVGDKAQKGAAWVGDKVKRGAGWALGKLKQGASWLGNKGKQLYDGVKGKAVQTWDDMKKGMAQEGAMGFLKDPVGVMDRQQAQRELGNRFQVVADDYKGVRASNTVSQAEYQRICRTYSDIRLGRGDLTIDEDAKDKKTGGKLKTKEEREAYRSGALNDIATMLQTGSGRREIDHLQNAVAMGDDGKARRSLWGFGPQIHHHSTMVPLLNADGTYDRTNGYAAPTGSGSRREINADGTLGKRGSGSDVDIRYNPGVNIWDNDPQEATNVWAGQTRSDVLLAHEMNHAVHQTQGTLDPNDVQATDDASNATNPSMKIDQDAGIGRREHQAVGIGQYKSDDMTENAYRRERRQMADLGAVGQVTGRPGMGDSDAVMIERDTYAGRPAPSAAPPGSPSPSSTPGRAYRHQNDDDKD